LGNTLGKNSGSWREAISTSTDEAEARNSVEYDEVTGSTSMKGSIDVGVDATSNELPAVVLVVPETGSIM
jgi:hypothetical protein